MAPGLLVVPLLGTVEHVPEPVLELIQADLAVVVAVVLPVRRYAPGQGQEASGASRQASYPPKSTHPPIQGTYHRAPDLVLHDVVMKGGVVALLGVQKVVELFQVQSAVAVAVHEAMEDSTNKQRAQEEEKEGRGAGGGGGGGGGGNAGEEA